MTATPSLMALQHRYRDDIIKVLDRVQAAGRRPSRIFEDWTDLLHANLIELPRHVQAMHEGNEHEDLPATQEIYERLRGIYRREYFELFARAQALLWQSAEDGYMDVLGSVYMEWGWPSKGHGQYFTPLNVAVMMGQIINGGAGEEVNDHVRDAIARSPAASAMLMAGLTLDDPQLGLAWYISRVIPHALDHYEPVAVNDPCCGSGIMFLAHASTLPWWQVQLGLVQYYGQDIDRLCVRMAQTNSMLYGLNGRYAPYIVSYYDWLFRRGGASEELQAVEAEVLEDDVDEPHPLAPPPLQEKEGWNPDDFIQRPLFGGKVNEIEPVYVVETV